jgi:uncharacterized membrane protein
MIYTTSIVIDAPLQEVVSKFDSEDNLKHWMRGLQSIELIEGQKGEVGAKSLVKFDMGKRKVEMTETILLKDLPNSIHMSYTTKGVYNVVKNQFKDLGDGRTEMSQEQEFQFDSWGMKVLGFLMPGAFKKTSNQYATDFKNFVEKGSSVLDLANESL